MSGTARDPVALDAWREALALVEGALEDPGLSEYHRMQLSVGVVPHLHQAIGDLEAGADPAEVARIRQPLPGLLEAFADDSGALPPRLDEARKLLARGLTELTAG